MFLLRFEPPQRSCKMSVQLGLGLTIHGFTEMGLPVPSANLEASNLDYRYGRIQLLKTYNCYEVIIL